MSEYRAGIEECSVGLSHVDFELVDRFYDAGGTELKLGTIQSSKENEIVVLFDDGTETTYSPSHPKGTIEDRLIHCGKPLDLSQLEVGSIISQILGGERIFAQVTYYVHGKLVEAKFVEPPHLPMAMTASSKVSLEKKMAYWNLEG
jgi:hypothetical protein